MKHPECARHGCREEGHPALGDCCSVHCRDIEEQRQELGEVLRERDELRQVIVRIVNESRAQGDGRLLYVPKGLIDAAAAIVIQQGGTDV